MVGLNDVDLKHAGDCDLPGRAIDALNAASRQVRDRVVAQGWVLRQELAIEASSRTIVRLSMLRDGIVVSTCGFVIGPGRSVTFERPADRGVTRAMDAMGEAEFRRLIDIWVEEVQAGVAHHWHYEAKRLGKPNPPEG